MTTAVRLVVVFVGVFAAFFGGDLELLKDSDIKDAVTSIVEAVIGSIVVALNDLVNQKPAPGSVGETEKS